LSSEDQSPELPKEFLRSEGVAQHRMKKLARLLKNSEKQQNNIVGKVQSLHDFIRGELFKIRTLVQQDNTKLSDDISSLSHDVVGPSGPPGLPGIDFIN
jgi:hypothetical protein